MTVSNCCSAPIINDDMCSKCLEHCDEILDDYPVLPVEDAVYSRVKPWFGVGLLLIIIILILL